MRELVAVAPKLGVDVLSGALRQRLVVIIAPVEEAGPATYTCGVCGFAMNEVGSVRDASWQFGTGLHSHPGGPPPRPC
jgi:hypothetical protein